uniref:2'-deoxynucleoside 5'-phosphate N-hydrolase 1 n=1 Tax=Bos indicus x Bos taurus TaxID=30522 RepID=A0A4W2F8K6_BOBOX
EGWIWGCVGQRRGTEAQGGPLTSFPSTTGEEAAGGHKLIHDWDLAWLQQADVVVAEVTQPSLGVGYELGRAVALHKPVLCLFRPQSDRGEHPPALASFPSSLRSQSSSPSLGNSEHSAHPRKGWEREGQQA